MKKLAAFICAFCAIGVFAQTATWDLRKDEISPDLKVGNVKVESDGSVLLPENASFAVPAKAFPDINNFTVQITVSYGEIGVGANMQSLISLEGKQDSGFGIGINRNFWYEGYIPRVNRMLAMMKVYGQKKGRTNVGEPITFTIYAKNGIVSFYHNDVPGAKIFSEVIKCDAPMWVGKDRRKFGELKILDLKVFDKTFQYKSPKEKLSATPMGVRVGKGWNMAVPFVTDKNRARVLVYGDSISMGYKPRLDKVLNNKVYVDHWCGFAGGHKIDKKIYSSAAASAPYDVIIFNNGLHSTHWSADKVTDEQVYNSYRDMARGFREGAPKAKLIYLNTTPVNDGPLYKDKPLGLDEKRNGVVVRLNKFAAQAMKDEGIEVIEVYSTLKDKLELMTRDGFHWHGEGYDIIAKMVGDEVIKELKARNKLK